MQTIIHKSPVLLAFRIISLELLAELIYLLVGAGANLLANKLNYEIHLISPLTQLLLLPIQVWILVVILLKWSYETYEIREEELIIRSGVLRRTEQAYPYRNMQSVIMRQSLFERMIGAGTITIYVPTLGKDLIFSEVPSPKAFAESIKKVLPHPDKGQFIMRR